jgi:hypothetical protein
MNKSESIKNLASALKKAQSEMGEVKFDATNPFLKNRYASLGAVIQASKDAMVNNGLSVSQPAISDEHGVGITTLLMHESGEWLETSITLPLGEEKGKSQAQVAGSIISYLRRYSLASLLNLYSDEDTDGNAPQKKTQSKPVQNAQPKTGALTLEEAMAETGSDGKTYGDCSTEELDKKMIGITKWLNNKANINSPKMDSYIQKMEAIKLIKAKRG